MPLGREHPGMFISAPDVVVYADPALTNPLRAVGNDFRARTGVPVRVFASPGSLLIELLARGTRNDVLVTVDGQMQAAARRALVQPDTVAGPWRSAVVLAARAPAPPDPAFAAALADGRLAVIDPVAADRMDGLAAVRSLGWLEAASGRIDGFPSGQEVAFAVETGAARLGLLQRCDLFGHRRLVEIAAPDAMLQPAFRAAIGHNALSRFSVPFMAYLASAEATARLHEAGLEAAA